MTIPKIWVLVDNRIGNANQAIVLAEKLGQPFEIKHINYNHFAKFPNSILSLFSNEAICMIEPFVVGEINVGHVRLSFNKCKRSSKDRRTCRSSDASGIGIVEGINFTVSASISA